MRLSKTAIHDNLLSANTSAPQQRCAQLIVDTICRFIDGLFGDNRENDFEPSTTDDADLPDSHGLLR
jgi:hypothetical protein